MYWIVRTLAKGQDFFADKSNKAESLYRELEYALPFMGKDEGSKHDRILRYIREGAERDAEKKLAAARLKLDIEWQEERKKLMEEKSG